MATKNEDNEEPTTCLSDILKCYQNEKAAKSFETFLLENSLKLTDADPSDPETECLWDSLLLGVLVENVSDHKIGKCEDAIQIVRGEEEENLERNILSDSTSITKLQVSLELAFNICKSKSPLSATLLRNDITKFKDICSSQTHLWSLLHSELQLNAKLFLFSKESQELFQFWNGFEEKSSPGQAPLELVFVYDQELNTLRRVVEAAKFYNGNTNQYCEDILESLVASQELTSYLTSIFRNIEPDQLHPYIARSLNDISRQETIQGAAKVIEALSPEENKIELAHLSALVKKEPVLLAQENDDGQKLLHELRSAYSYCLLQACKEVLEEKMGNERQKCILLQEEEDRLLVENDRLETLIEKAEAEKKEREEKIRELEQSLESADERRKELIRQEIAQLEALNSQKSELQRHKEQFAWNDFKNKLIGVDVSFSAFQRYVSEKSAWKSATTVVQLVQMLSSTFSIQGLPELSAYCENNNSKEEMDQLFEILNNVFQPPTINYCPSDRSKLEVKGRFVVTSDLLQQLRNYNFKEIQILATGSLFIDCDLPKNIFHGRNVAICTPKLNVTKASVIDTSGYNGQPEKVLPQASSGQEEGRDGFDGMDGAPGESGGNVYIYAAEVLNPQNLEIRAIGGNGGHGQSGGHGRNGKDGHDGPDGHVEDQNWWTSRVCYKIDRGRSGWQGQRGGTGGAAGLGGLAGLAGIIDLQIGNGSGEIKTVSQNGQQGRDGQVGSGGSGGTGGRNGVDHGVAWHNYKFAGGEFRYARGKLDVKRQRVWYGGNGWTLIIQRSEWDVRNSRANRGENAISGQSKTNAKSRQKASVNKRIQKDQVLNSFTSLVQLHGAKGQNQKNMLSELKAALSLEQASVNESERKAKMDTSARDSEQSSIAQQMQKDRTNLASESERKAELEAELISLDKDLGQTLEAMENVKKAHENAKIAASEKLKELQGQMQEIAATVQQQRRANAEVQMESTRRGRQQLTKEMRSTMKRKECAAPKVVKRRATFKFKDKTSKPKKALPEASSIEKLQFKIATLKEKEKPEPILENIQAVLLRKLGDWYKSQLSSPKVNVSENSSEENLSLLNYLAEKVTSMIREGAESESVQNEITLEVIYKSLISTLSAQQALKSTGNALWESLAMEMVGFAKNKILFWKTTTSEDILKENLTDALKILQREVKVAKRRQADFLLRKVSFVLSHVEIEEESNWTVQKLDIWRQLVDDISFSVKANDGNCLERASSMKCALYKLYTTTFQEYELEHLMGKLGELDISPELKSKLEKNIQEGAALLESPFHNGTFQDRLNLYAKWSKSLEGKEKELEILKFGSPAILPIPDVLKNLEKLYKLFHDNPTWQLQEVKNAFQLLQASSLAISATPESSLSRTDILKISEAVNNCCGMLATTPKEQIPPVLLQAIRDFHNALSPHWMSLLNRGYQETSDAHDKDKIAAKEWMDSCIELLTSYVEASDQLLFKADVVKEARIHLERLSYADALLGKTWRESRSEAEEWARSVKAQMEEGASPLISINIFIGSLQRLSNKKCEEVLPEVKKNLEGGEATDLDCYCRSDDSTAPENLLKCLRRLTENKEGKKKVYLSALYKILLLKFPFLSYKAGNESVDEEAAKSWNAVRELCMEMGEQLEDLSVEMQSRWRNVLNLVALQLGGLDYQVYGRILEEECSGTIGRKQETTKYLWEKDVSTFRKILDIFANNSSILSYTGTVLHFNEKLKSIPETQKAEGAYERAVNKIFLESTCRFFSRNSIPAMPSDVRGDIWNLFSDPTRFGKILAKVLEAIGPTMEADEYEWVKPFLHVFTEFINQINPESLHITSEEIHQVGLKILETVSVLRTFKQKSAQDEAMLKKLMKAIISLSKRATLFHLERKLDDEEDNTTLLQNAEYAFWAIFEGPIEEMAILTSIYSLATTNSFTNPELQKMFAKELQTREGLSESTQLTSISEALASAKEGSSQSENFPSRLIRFAIANFLLGATLSPEEVDTCNRLLNGVRNFIPPDGDWEVCLKIFGESSAINRVALVLHQLQEPSLEDLARLPFLTGEEVCLISSILQIILEEEEKEMVEDISEILWDNSCDDWFQLLLESQKTWLFKRFTECFLKISDGDLELEKKFEIFCSSHLVDGEQEKDFTRFLEQGQHPLLEKMKELFRLKYLYNRCHFFTDSTLDLIVWLERVLTFCETGVIHITQLNDLIYRCSEIPAKELIKLSSATFLEIATRETVEKWMQGVTLYVLGEALKIYLKNGDLLPITGTETIFKDEQLDADQILKPLMESSRPSFMKTRLYATLSDRIEEMDLTSREDFNKGRRNIIKLLQNIDSSETYLTAELLQALSATTLSFWDSCMKRFKYRKLHGKNMAEAVLKFEAIHGEKSTAQLMETAKKAGFSSEEISKILTNFTSLKWQFDSQLITNIGTLSKFSQVEELCQNFTETFQKQELDFSKLIKLMRDDKINSSITSYLLGKDNEAPLLQSLGDEVKSWQDKRSGIYTECTKVIREWTEGEISKWAKLLKEKSDEMKEKFIETNLEHGAGRILQVKSSQVKPK